MLKGQLTVSGFAILAILATLPAARATTVDTFSFTESGWSIFEPPGGPSEPFPTANLTGTFTGVVETNGFIELADLSSYNVIFSIPNESITQSLGDLSLFSYDINGGSSSLDVAGNHIQSICVGAASTLDPICTGNFDLNYPVGTNSIAEGPELGYYVSSSQPVITLVSSVTTNPTVTPEPRSTVFVILALTALVLVRARTKSTRTL